VLGRGFTSVKRSPHLIQLLRFLDNKTDELALAAVLRFATLRSVRQCLVGAALRALV